MEHARAVEEARARALRRNRLRLIALAVLLVIVAMFAAIWGRDYLTVPEARLPDVVGMSYPAAVRLLRRAGVQPAAFLEDMADAGPDAVTSETPAGGAVVRRGRTVHIGVNNPPAEVPIPPLAGLTETQALQRAAELNLPVTSLVYRADSKAAGLVIGQQPAAGSRLAADGGLELTVSEGPAREPLQVPDLRGMDHAAAVAKLKALGFTEVESLPGGLSFDKPGAVTGLQPQAGSIVPPGTPVAVFYALSGLTIVRVPAVTGMSLRRARLVLEAARLRIGYVSYVQRNDKPGGVLKVEPSGYTLPGTPVQVTVNGQPAAAPLALGTIGGGAAATLPPRAGEGDGSPRTAAPGMRTIPFVFDPNSMGMKRLLLQPYRLKLVVRDAQGERTVLDRSMKAGESVTLSVQVYGSSPLLQTYIDGVFFQAWRP